MSKITSVEELAKKVKKLSVLYKASEADIEIIEAFIRTTLTNRDKEIVALANSMRKHAPHIGIGHLHEADMELAYNNAIDDIITALSDSK